jgi:hypothetical protein
VIPPFLHCAAESRCAFDRFFTYIWTSRPDAQNKKRLPLKKGVGARDSPWTIYRHFDKPLFPYHWTGSFVPPGYPGFTLSMASNILFKPDLFRIICI